MKTLLIAMAVGAAALAGGSAANATTPDTKVKPSVGTSESTDMSAHRRYYRHSHRYGHYRPYYGSYGYYRPSYGYYGGGPYGYRGGPYGYYGGGPGITFGFGTGGYRW